MVDPADYDWVADRTGSKGLSLDERRYLAHKAFRHVSQYDTTIAQYLDESQYMDQSKNGSGKDAGDGALPEALALTYRRAQELRYGENPHQRAALYLPSVGQAGGVSTATQLHGKEISFNNLLDAEAAWRTASDFGEPAVVVIKHTNPCGLACHSDQAEAYRRAYAGDPVSAFGGIVGFNRTVTVAAAEEMSSIFYEVVVAPDYEPGALEILSSKRNLRLLAVSGSEGAPYDVRTLGAGLPRADTRRPPRGPELVEDGDGEGSYQGGDHGSGFRVEGGKAYQVQRHRARQGPGAAGNGRGPAQPCHQRAPGSAGRW